MKKRFPISLLSAIILSALILSSCGPRETTSNLTFRYNHNTGDRISLLGFGMLRLPWLLDENGVPKRDELGRRIVDQEATNRLIDMAIANGVNFFDNAPVYLDGMNEKAVGIALSRHPRESFFVSSKLSTHREGADFSFEAGKAMYLQSFKDLQVDVIDYYFLHGIGIGGMQTFRERHIYNGMLDFLLAEREAGRIRNLGWSFHGCVTVFDTMFEMGIHWDFAMIQMNYMDWQHASGRNINAEYLYGKLIKHNIPIFTMSSLRGGQLSHLNPAVMEVFDRVTPGRTASEWGFRYLGSFDGILSILTGMNTEQQLRENIQTFSPMIPLSVEEMAAVKEVARILNTAGFINCTACDYCVPCPFGVNIPAVLVEYNRHIVEGIPIDPNNPILQQARLCIGEACGLCLPLCPIHVEIISEMRRIEALLDVAATRN
ncbi:MAG: aldo/keto reductase [Bacteroidales bacterium]|nr:aldo/keto reductase [Bacteroidales bacterium]